MGKFSSHAKQRVEQVAQISFTKKHSNKAVLCNLRPMLLMMKTQIWMSGNPRNFLLKINVLACVSIRNLTN